MKLVKVAVTMALALTYGSAYAFHDGGVARCEGCHTMHNSSTGTATVNSKMTANALPIGTTNPYLLQGSDPSSTCLICHGPTSPGSYHVFDSNAVSGKINQNTVNMTPGGDFSWTEISQRNGHNIVAKDFPALAADTRLNPPGLTGSTWTGSNFSCVNCHDPHGQSRFTSATTQARNVANADGSVNGTGLPPIAKSGSYGGASYQAYAAAGTAGSYRLLGGQGWTPRSNAGSPVFAVNPPIALAPSTYNNSELAFTLAPGGHTGQTVVTYVSGMSDWCGTCHGAFHGQATSTNLGSTDLRHPSGATAQLNGLATNYNKYISTGNLNGTQAYDALMPVELGGTRDNAAALPVDITGTVAINVPATANVMCLTCHRAHASGFTSMLRWDMGSQFNSIGTSGDATGANGNALANTAAGYYYRGMNGAGNQYGSYQRAMCNKCHVKD